MEMADHDVSKLKMTTFSRNSTSQDGQIAGLYDLEDTLGCGHFAVVKVARHVFTGERVAVKVIDKTKLDEVSRAHLFTEVRCMKLVQHPHVVKLYEVIDTQTKLYLVLELGDGGDMYEYIINHEQGLSEEKARHYFRQIVLAIDYCHKLHIVHRDLKLENVIFFKSLDVAKLTDFGFSNKFIPGKMLDTSCGSLAYSAPEVLLGDSYEAPAVDVWSLGVILFMLVCGRAPFYEVNDSETLTKIMDCRYHISDHVSPECRRLIAKMLVREPYCRSTIEDIMEDPWLLEGHPPLFSTPVPLVTELPLTPEEHNYVLNMMETGNIADRETVRKSLENNPYNHVTATYYLLAEQLLRRLKATNGSLEPNSAAIRRRRNGRLSLPENRRLEPRPIKNSPLALEDKENESDTHSDSGSGSGSASASPRVRRNSSGRLAPREGQLLNKKIQEHAIEVDEVLHSSMEEDELPACPNLISTGRTFHCMNTDLPSSSTSSLTCSTNSQYSTEDMIMPSFQPRPREKKFRHLVGKAKSTPLSLNQIYEERESDLEDSPVNSPRVERTKKHLGGGVMKTKRTTRRLSPVPSGGSRRSSSCSSSDEDEIEKHMRRLKTNSGCKLKSTRENRDDGNPDGDSGGNSGLGGGSSLSPKVPARTGSGTNRDQTSSNKNQHLKGEGKGKSNCLELNGLVTLCEDIRDIDENNKENIVDNVTDNSVKVSECSVKPTPLIEDYDVLSSKSDEPDERNGFCREKRNSAVKYIQAFTEEERTLHSTDEICNGKQHTSFDGITRLQLTDRGPPLKDSMPAEIDGKNMRLMHNPAMQSVTSNCCQIF